jgi:hypothetical protein
MNAYGLTDYVVEMIKRMLAAGHMRAWSNINYTRVSDEVRVESGGFVFVTLDPEVAMNAKDALQAAGVLCNTDLGYFDPQARETLLVSKEPSDG